MNISALEIRKQEFGRQLRGYDVAEVTSFLENVATAYERLQKERAQFSSRVEFLEAKLKEQEEKESSYKDVMMTAQKAGRVAEEDSSKRSEEMLQSAKLEAEKIVNEARSKHRRLMDDIDRLEGQRRSFLLKMKQILRGQVELLEILESEAIDDGREKSRPSGLAPDLSDSQGDQSSTE